MFLNSTAKVHRVPASAIYLTKNTENVPPALLLNLKYTLVLHDHVLLVKVESALKPWVDAAKRLTVTDLGRGFTRVVIHYGLAETPDVPLALTPLTDSNPNFNPITAAYFLSRQTLVP